MKRVYVNEEWCLGCRLCEYNCAFANSGIKDMVIALKGKPIFPRIHIAEAAEAETTVKKSETGVRHPFPISCRHCEDPICVKSCIAGAISRKNGIVVIDKEKCVGCFTCILVCPYGSLAPNGEGIMQKCELCAENACGEPACVKGCPNRAIIFEERGDEK